MSEPTTVHPAAGSAGRRPTVASVDLGRLRANYDVLRRAAAPCEVVCVVKADAYGHGLRPVARTLAAAGAHSFAVQTLDEAEPLRREHGSARILVLGGVHDAEEARLAAGLDLTPVVHDEGAREWLAKAGAERGRPVSVHLEVDTGMRRMGVAADEALAIARRIERDPGLHLEGAFSHFACADEPDLAASRAQLDAFAGWLDRLAAEGIAPAMVHVANSAGLLGADALPGLRQRSHAVRPGLALYGVRPAAHFDVSLEPVMTLRTRLTQVRRVAAGESVGYGADWRATHDTRIGTLPIGYAAGVPWQLGGRGEVAIGKARCPIVGRVSMDYLTIDLGASVGRVGHDVVLFGRPGPRGDAVDLPVEVLARAAGTIAYELLARIGPRVPRVYQAAPDALVTSSPEGEEGPARV